MLLSIAVKAMNNTLGPDGIVPSALVFGEFPSLRSFEVPRIPKATLADRAHIANFARKVMSEELANSKITRALRHNVPNASDRTFEPGD